MKTETKYKLKVGFASLIKNDAAIEAAKTIPGYVPVIIGLVAAFLPVIPLMVSTSNTYGSQFLKSQDYNLSLYQTDALMSVNDEGYEFKLIGDKLQRYKDDILAPMAIEDEIVPMDEYVVTDATGKSKITFQLFYSDRVNNGSVNEKIKTLVSAITDTTYLVETTFQKDSQEAEDYIKTRNENLLEGETYTPSYYRPSFTIIYSLGIYTYVNNEATNKKVTTVGGDWKHSKLTTEEGGLLKRVLNVNSLYTEDKASYFEKDTNGDYILLRDLTFRNDVQKKMNKVYDEAYITSKNTSFLMYTLIFYGVYVVLIGFMGLMIFLLTRGKKNPMNYMSFWLSTKIAAWATISPAVLALILGFLLTNFATMFFIILFGVRIMWLSMRQLRPAY
ncbi:MAG: hypothetical protein IJM28_03315 [Lachnospiraceae bacterium]|nr:hypothetical protein [Lachnospiraceae bacterium]